MKIISIDYDNTIWNGKEIINKDKINTLFEIPENFIIIYTSRSYNCFEEIRNTLLKNEIKFHAIVCEKIRADCYIDDLNIGGLKWH